MDDVVVIPRASLLDDHIAGMGVQGFHVGENALDVGRGQSAEEVGAEHAGHPVAAAVVLELLHFDLTGFVIEAIIGKQPVQNGAVDFKNLQGRFCARGKLARL